MYLTFFGLGIVVTSLFLYFYSRYFKFKNKDNHILVIKCHMCGSIKLKIKSSDDSNFDKMDNSHFISSELFCTECGAVCELNEHWKSSLSFKKK